MKARVRKNNLKSHAFKEGSEVEIIGEKEIEGHQFYIAWKNGITQLLRRNQFKYVDTTDKG